MELEEALPPSLCLTCSVAAFEAAEFKTLVQRAQRQWSSMVNLLDHIPDHKYALNSHKILAVVSNNCIKILDRLKPPVEKRRENPILKRPGKLQECQCPNCGNKFQYAVQLNKHLGDSLDLLRACHICAEVMSRSKLIKHVKDEHHLKTYPCKKCPAILTNAKLFTDHNLKAHAKGSIKCVDCSYTFQTTQALNAHQHIHTKRSCPNCDKIFQNQPCYSYHIQKCCKLDLKHKSKQVPVTLLKKENKQVKMGKRGSITHKCICDYCNKTYAAKKFLTAHMQIVHLKNTHKPCVYCSKQYAAAHMSTHLKSHKKASFKCEHCGVVLKSKLGFKQHLRLHSGERPYECNICGEHFSSSSRMSEHKRNKHFKSQIVLKYVCIICSAKFRLPSKLKMHMDKVHKRSGMEERSFKCELCQEMFDSCQSLMNHLRNH